MVLHLCESLECFMPGFMCIFRFLCVPPDQVWINVKEYGHSCMLILFP